MSRILKNVIETAKRLNKGGFLAEASMREFETLCDSRRQPKKMIKFRMTKHQSKLTLDA